MDLISADAIVAGAAAVLQPAILMWILAGVLLGFIFGAAPGLTATTGVALATPLTFGVDFEVAMAALLGIYSAGYFAGSIPAILINTPGAPGNAATALDGYRLARAGKADLAISLAVVASAIGGLVSILALFLAAPSLARFALAFTSVEYFALGLLGLICVAAVSGRSLLKGVLAAAFGMTLGVIGVDEVGGLSRLTLGTPELQSGVPLIPALIAFFALAEILSQTAARAGAVAPTQQTPHPLARLPRLFARHAGLLLKSSAIGTLIGVLPGTGPTIASWVAYGQAGGGRGPEGDRAGDPEGALEAAGQDAVDEARAVRGVIASESANNAVTGGAMVPLLTLGIPGDTVTAVLIGALLIQGIDPGPFFLVERPDLFAQILVILMVAALLTLVVGLGARTVLPRMLAIPGPILMPVIAVLCAAGGYAVSHASFEVGLIAVLGVIGFVLIQFGFPAPPIVIGLVLGPIVETNLRNGLIANDMDPSVFVTRPISGVILAVIAVVLIWSVVKRRATA